MLSIAVARFLADVSARYVTLRTSGFVDHVTFSHQRTNGRESETDAHVSSSSPDGGTSQTSDNVIWSNAPAGGTGGDVCRLRLCLVLFYDVMLRC